MAEPRARNSLRGRLLILLAFPLLGLLALSVVADYRTALRLANESYDRGLTQAAVALASRLERDKDDEKIEIDLPPAAEAILRSDLEDNILYVVLDAGGDFVTGDRKLLGLSWPTGSKGPSFADAQLDGAALRLVRFPYASEVLKATVIVAETTHKRDRTASGILSAVIWPNVVLIVATLLLVLLVVRLSLRPLDALGDKIAARAPDDLSPIPDTDIPDEARPLVSALNRLMGHLVEAARAQQAFLSNAAHQLRTPLAGLLAQLDLAARTLPEDARPRVERIQAVTRRLSHLTHQMLSLARSSPEAGSALDKDFCAVDLAVLLEDSASEFLDAAVDKAIDLGFETAPTMIEGSDWLLRELIANLIDNAITYTQRGGHVTARCGIDADGSGWLELEDDGPGIPVSERAQVFERFYRLGGGSADGAGLGLSIVREVALRHHARVGVSEGEGGRGLRIRVTFPRTPFA
ncbi:sensor histidine kinase [Azoarcus sp. L1K30]|uniref:sensor histidine kinase n=1 Tax=Azoarcus sp. L1K30 TaxID=2820277 RepID=UPI001B83626C|nr:sensor histidine kinase [Azoarcus sp. L1K30]